MGPVSTFNNCHIASLLLLVLEAMILDNGFAGSTRFRRPNKLQYLPTDPLLTSTICNHQSCLKAIQPLALSVLAFWACTATRHKPPP